MITGAQRAYSKSSGSADAYTGTGYFETLSFELPENVDPTGFTLVTFHYAYSGTLTSTARSHAEAYGFLALGDGVYRALAGFYALSVNDPFASYRFAEPHGLDSYNLVQTGDSSWDLTGVYRLYHQTPKLVITSILETITMGDATADYSHTARISIEVPEGIKYTSASGSFLTATGVPEPRSWALLIVGMGLVGWAMRAQARARLSLGRSSAPRSRR